MTEESYYVWGFRKDYFFALLTKCPREFGGVYSNRLREGWKMFWRKV